jgi:hypothetical protein
MSVAALPDEADAPLIVDADAVPAAYANEMTHARHMCAEWNARQVSRGVL